ncbi:MAG: metallophosphatase domain-containing protein [Myxococcota bacterium]
MRVVCLSDVHSRFAGLVVPDGDLLVVAGDLTRRGTREEIGAFDDWLATLPHPHKVVIAGNHDFGFERDPAARTWITAGTYLQDEGCRVGGLSVWGSPWQPRFFDWAFNLDRGAPLEAVWAKIPVGTDLLVTHGPPHGILDQCFDGRSVGDEALRDAVLRIRPRLHVFGHIHEAYGQRELDGIRFVNASTCSLAYVPDQAPIVIDL